MEDYFEGESWADSVNRKELGKLGDWYDKSDDNHSKRNWEKVLQRDRIANEIDPLELKTVAKQQFMNPYLPDDDPQNHIGQYKYNKLIKKMHGRKVCETENKLKHIIKESIKSVLKEENENATDKEWILNSCRIVIENNRPIYELYNWLVNCVAKLIRRGVAPSIEHLANCSTMKNIVRQAFKVNDITPRLHKEEYKKVCLKTAYSIINDVQPDIYIDEKGRECHAL